MTRFFEQRDRWGNGYALWALAAMAFAAPLVCWSLKQIRLHNDVEHWLPSDDPQAQVLDWYSGHFPIEDRVLVSWTGSSLFDRRVAAFQKKLEGELDAQGIRRNRVKQVEHVVTPQEIIERMVAHGVEPVEAVKRLQGVLIGTGELKVKLTEAGRRNKQMTIQLLVEQVKARLGVDLQIDERKLQIPEQIAYPAAEPSEDEASAASVENPLVEIAGTLRRDYDLQATWRGMNPRSDASQRIMHVLRNAPGGLSSGGVELVEDCFFQAGAPIGLSVTLSEAGSADPTGAFRAIRKAAGEVGIEETDLLLGGRPVAGSALNQEVKKAAWNRDVPLWQLHRRSPLLLSVVVGVVLAFVVLRSVRLAVLVIVVANYTMLLAVALVPLTRGSMNMVLVVMPTLLSVLTISAAIHVVNYWRHAAALDLRTAVVEATRMARQPCLLASLTTAIGLLSLTTSPLAPVRDFGLYSAIGCMTSLIMVLFGLPALLQFVSLRPPTKRSVDRTGWRRSAEWLADHWLIVSAGCVVLFAIASCGFNWFRTETKVIRYFRSDSPVVQNYRFLEDRLSGIVPVETIVRFDDEAQRSLNFLERLELVRAIQEKLRRHREISGSLSLADFQPATTLPAPNARFLEKARFHKRANRVEARVKQSADGPARAFLTSARPSMVNAPGSTQPLSRAGDELWRIGAQAAILTDVNYGELTRDVDEIAKSVLKYHPGAGHVVTGMVPLFLRTQQAVLDSLIRSFALAFAVIAVVMMILLKNPLAGLLTMLPNLVPVGVVFGLISWAGLSVDIGTMITASVALGIAVDGSLHLLTWFRADIAAGATRREAVGRALAHCGPAMCQTSAAVGIGLLMLAPAELLLVSRFGWLMAALMGAALAADLIFLPALLAGPLGALIERTVAKTRAAESDLGARFTSHPTAQPSGLTSGPHLQSRQTVKTAKHPRLQ